MARNGSTWLIVFAIVGLYLWDAAARSSVGADRDSKQKSHEGTRIALVDMAQIFKTSKEFDRKREGLKLRIAEQEDVAKSKQKAAADLSARLQRLESGTEERRTLEIQLEKLKHEFEEYRKKMQSEFLKAESQIYSDTYQAVTDIIAEYAHAHEIDLVIRTTADPLNAKGDPQALMQSMNRQVVYENGLDITEAIVALVNGR